MTWHETVLQTIDLRSFSNLWFWICLAVTWSCLSHWVLGIPYDLVLRAARKGGQAEADLEALSAINARRVHNFWSDSGVVITAGVTTVLTCLILLGWSFGHEFSQAMTLLLTPVCGVFALQINAARHILAEDAHGEALFRRLRILRVATQVIGMFAIFVTALWGMFVNLSLGTFL